MSRSDPIIMNTGTCVLCSKGWVGLGRGKWRQKTLLEYRLLSQDRSHDFVFTYRIPLKREQI